MNVFDSTIQGPEDRPNEGSVVHERLAIVLRDELRLLMNQKVVVSQRIAIIKRMVKGLEELFGPEAR